MTKTTEGGFALDPDRLSSGVGGLDTVLLGGFVKNGLYIIQGAPGAGKTILSNQICYKHASAGGRALYVTLLSEQHERLLSNLEQMSFFDPAKIAHEIIYVSAFQLLERDGLAGLLTLLRREIVAHAASLLVLDGLVAAEAYASTQLELKKFVHELQTLAAAVDCTMFLLTSSGMGNSDVSVVRPEHTMVDGIISLHDTEYGWRVERDVLVRKFRGSDHLRGRHAMCITSDGIVVWPRTESLPLPSERLPRDPNAPRLSTGVAGLDTMIGGGLSRASSTLALGPAGAGKTALGLQFLSGCTEAAPGIFLGFYETPERLLTRAEGLAPSLPALVQSGAVQLKWCGAAEGLIDRVAHELLRDVEKLGAARVVIDGLLGFEDMTVQPARIPHFYKALTDQLREKGVTSLCTAEMPDLSAAVAPQPLQRLSTIAENLILLRHVEAREELQRFVSVVKLRDSAFDTRLRSFTIGQGGIVLDDAGATLGGQAGAEPGAAAPGG